jgi:hypothetical protein
MSEPSACEDAGPLVFVEFVVDCSRLRAALASAQRSVDAMARTRRRRDQRLQRSGPNRLERQIAHAYRLKPKQIGIGPPPLAIDGHAYHRRQRNRVKRRRR